MSSEPEGGCLGPNLLPQTFLPTLPSLCAPRPPQAPSGHARPSAPAHGPAGRPAAPGGAPARAGAAGPAAPPAPAPPPAVRSRPASALSGTHEGKVRAPRTRGGLELRPQPPSLPPASPRPSAQSSTPCPFLGGRPCPQLPMDTPVPQLQVGQQEQELRQLLNKDKSKRSKDRTHAGWGGFAECGRGLAKGVGPRAWLSPEQARAPGRFVLREGTGQWVEDAAGRPPSIHPQPVRDFPPP